MKTRLMKWLSASTLFALVFAAFNPLEAGYGSSGGGSSGYGSGGGSSGYGSGGGSSGYGSGGGYGSSGGHVGPIRRLGARIHDHFQAKVARRAAYGSYGSSGGSSGGYSANYGSSGGSHGGYATHYAGSSGGGSSGGAYHGGYSSGGSSGGYAPAYNGGSTGGGSSGSSLQYGTYESYPSEVPMLDSGYSSGSVASPDYGSVVSGTASSTRTANKLASSQSIQPNEVHLTVNLPESAKVFVNGNLTSTIGARRHFISRDLKPKDAYRFEVKAVMTKEDGTELVQNKTVVVESGNGEELNFEMVKADDPIETILTLNVPEKARVVLAQNSTKSEGASRVFRTKQLHEGESWDDYKIEVTYEGVTKEKTIRLFAGDKLEFTFNFDATEGGNKVAMK